MSAIHSQSLPQVTVLIRSMLRPELKEAIHSITRQTYSHLHVHIVNASAQPLTEDYAELYPDLTIKVFQPDTSLPRAAAANYLLNTVSSGFAIFLDEDDIFYPDHLEKLVSALNARTDLVAAYTGVSLYQSEQQQSGLDEEWSKHRLFIANYLPIHAVLFDVAKVQQQNCRFDENLNLMEDWDFWLQLSQISDFYHVPGISAVYRMDLGQSELSSEQQDKQLAAHQKVFAKWNRSYNTHTDISAAMLWLQNNYQLTKHQVMRLQAETSELQTQFSQLSLSSEKKVKKLTNQNKILIKSYKNMMNSSQPTIDVIVPIYKGLEETQACIESVLTARNTLNQNLILINDCSPEPELSAWLRTLQDLPNVTLLENQENLGFVATVNKGMEQTQNDVLLLNSDTEVADGWLDRIYQAAQLDETIGTVTPFSNNATICSYPKFCEDNELPQGMTFEELDQLFAQILPVDVIDIPTGVGFCMFIKRKCLAQVGLFNVEVFGKGYGEENDFSRRVVKHGWRNVLAANVFVWHKGNVSFGDSHNDRKAQALKTLDEMYPDYNRIVHEHIAQDPAKAWRYAVDLARWQQQPKKHVLFVSHSSGGGTETHTRELADALSSTMRVFMLKPDQGGNLLLEAYNHGESMKLWFNAQNLSGLTSVLQELDIGQIHFHHLLGFKLEVLSLLLDYPVRKVFTAHDYYSFCPQITMTLNEREYCQEKGVEQCQQCLSSTPGMADIDINQWRDGHLGFLQKMDLIIAPSQYAADKMQAYFPNLPIQFLNHPDTDMQPIAQVASPKKAAQEPLRVAMIGAISPAKGADRLLAVAQLAEQQNLNIEFKVFGFLYKPAKETKNFTLTGRYDNQKLPEMLQQWQPHIVWFPGDFPETHCYTLSTVLSLGLPVVSNDLGAVAERINQRPLSYQLPWQSNEQEWCQWFADYAQRLESMDKVTELWSIPKVPEITQSNDYLQPVAEANISHADAQQLMAYTHYELSTWQKMKSKGLAIAFKLRETPLAGAIIGKIPDGLKKRVKYWLQGH